MARRPLPKRACGMEWAYICSTDICPLEFRSHERARCLRTCTARHSCRCSHVDAWLQLFALVGCSGAGLPRRCALLAPLGYETRALRHLGVLRATSVCGWAQSPGPSGTSVCFAPPRCVVRPSAFELLSVLASAGCAAPASSEPGAVCLALPRAGPPARSPVSALTSQ